MPPGGGFGYRSSCQNVVIYDYIVKHDRRLVEAVLHKTLASDEEQAEDG